MGIFCHKQLSPRCSGPRALLDALLIPRKLLPWEVKGWGIALSPVSVRAGSAMGKISCFPGKRRSLTCAPGPSGAAVCLIPWDSCVPEGDVQLNAVFMLFVSFF